MVILEKAILSFQVTIFIFYANILGLKIWMNFQRLKNVVGRRFRYLERIAFKFGFQQSGSINMDQTETLSIESGVQQNSIQIMPSEKAREALKTKGGSPMSHLPIVFLHYSNSDYLKYSLGQAKNSNPKSTVYLIGDQANDCYDFVGHHSFSDYFQGANNFSKIYRHFNANSYKYEIFSFQRWFILHEFLVTNKIEKCLYLDSDTMLYADVTEESEKFAQFDFTLSYKTCGCIFFLNRVEALTDFCQFLTDIYTKKERLYFDRMLAQYATFNKNGMAGGACDMTAFDFYSYDHFGEIGEVSQIKDDSVYDPSINLPHPGFEMENGIKKVIWKDGKPYGRHLRTGKEIQFNSLHFQGVTQRLMDQYYTGSLFKFES